MARFQPAITSLVSSIILVFFSSETIAAERWKILVLGETSADAAQEPAYYKRANTVIEQQLIEQNYDVYDRDAIGASLNCGESVCSGLTNEDLIRTAKGADTGIDLVVLYSILLVERKGPATSRWRLEIPARMIDIQSGRVVDQWSESRLPFAGKPRGCDEKCEVDWFAEKAQVSARDLGAILQKQLSSYVRMFEYTLRFDGFPRRALEELSKQLQLAPGLEGASLETLNQQQDRQWLHSLVYSTYRYETPMGGGELTQHIDASLDELGLNTVNRYDQESRSYSSVFSGVAYLPWYMAGMLLVLFTVVLLWLSKIYSATHYQLQTYKRQRQVEPGLAKLESFAGPWLANWKMLQVEWSRALDQSGVSLRSAQAAENDHHFEEARKLYRESDRLKMLPDLDQRLSDLDRKEQTLLIINEAESLLLTHPKQALSKVQDVRKLGCGFEEQIASVDKRACERLLAGRLQIALRKANDFKQSEDWYNALAVLDQFAHNVSQQLAVEIPAA